MSSFLDEEDESSPPATPPATPPAPSTVVTPAPKRRQRKPTEPPPNFDEPSDTPTPPKPNGSHHGRLNEPVSSEIPQNPRFPRVWLDDAEFDLSNDDYVKRIIGRQSNVLIYGPSGDGKTFFTLDLLLHVATGNIWRGLRTRECLVVYVAAEAGASILRRCVPWRNRYLSDTRERRTPFAILTRGANILDLGELNELLLELHKISEEAGLPIGIVAFDTLSRSMAGGDENASQDMTQIVAAADHIRDELKATTIFVHHAGKDVAKGARGHSSLFAAADTVIAVVEKVATLEKSRDGMSGENFPFELEVVDLGDDQDGDAVTTCLVRACDMPSTPKRGRELSGVAKVALMALREVVGEFGELLPQTSTIPAGTKGVKIERWRKQFEIRYGTDGERDQEAVKKAFQRGREALLKTSAVGISDSYCWLGYKE